MKPRAITVDGDRVVHRCAGKGPLLLLVHGMAGSSVTWRHFIASTTPARVPARSARRHGASPAGQHLRGFYPTLRQCIDHIGGCDISS
jgi:pimeloyl-ACP methyl ester carboxylesterase